MLIICPNCFEYVEILELFCCIFRHGVYINSMQQIDSHLNKIECDKLFNENKILGCGKPFQIINNEAIKCDYI